MNRRLLLWIAVWLTAALLPAPGLAARAAAEAWPMATALPAGALVEVELDRGAAVYTFTAASNSVYDICLFPADEQPPQASVQLWQGGVLQAEGSSGTAAVSQRLTAGEVYSLRLSGTGRVRLEVARHALSRCFAMPMPLDAAGDHYAKAIARPGDVHWYRVESDAVLATALAAVPEEADAGGQGGLQLQTQLFDGEGRMLAEAVHTVGGAALLDFTAEAGQPRWLRVSAANGATGLYELVLESGGAGAQPDRLALSRQALRLTGRSAFRLEARFSPEGSASLIYWESSDPGVAGVDARGVVTGRGPGTAVVTAYGAGGISARCRVEVGYVPVEGVRLLAERVFLNVGDDAAIECAVTPENASDPRVDYSIEPEGVAEIDASGVLRALAEGEATLTVRAADGGWEDAIPVSVGPAPKRWRALLVGEQGYASTVAAVRTGSANSVAGIRSMLGALSMGGSRFQVTTLLDASRDGTIAAIGEAFSGAAEGDLSMLYLTCHGDYTGGMTCLQMYDGSVLTAAELAQTLAAVPGQIFVVIDCCGSGGTIARGSDPGDILKGIDAVFDGMRGPSVMGGSRFRVLASAAMEQDSYRISFDDSAAESGMATVFARALCEAGGWDIDRGARSAMRADADYDGAVTLDELYRYTARRVMWYLSLAGRLSGGGSGCVQTVQAWPEGSADVVFARTAG